MTGLEIENFYKQNEEKYILENNREFLDWYNEKIKQGFISILDIKEMQRFINRVVMFFEFKFHTRLLIESTNYEKIEQFDRSKAITKMLDINELKYRLHHDENQFLECNYPITVTLRKKCLWDLSSTSVFVGKDGSINKYQLSYLKTIKYLDDNSDVKSITDLLGKYLTEPTDVDYTELEKVIFNHKTNLELRNKILELIPLAIIYSDNSLPIYGYPRAKSFIRMFNKEYKLNMTCDEIDEIMNRDYTKSPISSISTKLKRGKK